MMKEINDKKTVLGLNRKWRRVLTIDNELYMIDERHWSYD